MPVLILEALSAALTWLTTSVAGQTVIVGTVVSSAANSIGDAAEKTGKSFKDSGLALIVPIVGAILAYNYISKLNSKK